MDDYLIHQNPIFWLALGLFTKRTKLEVQKASDVNRDDRMFNLLQWDQQHIVKQIVSQCRYHFMLLIVEASHIWNPSSNSPQFNERNKRLKSNVENDLVCASPSSMSIDTVHSFRNDTQLEGKSFGRCQFPRGVLLACLSVSENVSLKSFAFSSLSYSSWRIYLLSPVTRVVTGRDTRGSWGLLVMPMIFAAGLCTLIWTTFRSSFI